MIQGFETREITDIPIRAFVKSADGTIHKKVKTVDQYENTEWPSFKDFSLPAITLNASCQDVFFNFPFSLT